MTTTTFPDVPIPAGARPDDWQDDVPLRSFDSISGSATPPEDGTWAAMTTKARP